MTKPEAISLMTDSPVVFPEPGALPSMYRPDVKADGQVPEESYWISGSPV